MRAKNAHLNCTENFPVFAAVVLDRRAARQDRHRRRGRGLRACMRALAQSLVHIAGTSMPLVALRGLFYFVQIVLIFYMIWRLLHA